MHAGFGHGYVPWSAGSPAVDILIICGAVLSFGLEDTGYEPGEHGRNLVLIFQEGRTNVSWV